MATGFLDNFYARLGLHIDASDSEIKDSYHQAALKFHPDTNKKGGATEIFLQIQEAYETLSNSKKRKKYDALLPNNVKGFTDLLTNTIYSRETISITDSKQLIYVLMNFVSFTGDNENDSQKSPPLNIAIVIDNSTSMKGSRIEAVKSTILPLIKNLKPQDIISIISFNDKAQVILSATKNPSINLVKSQISQISTRGGTELFQGLSLGAEEVRKNISPGLINQIILLTDGKTYGDEEQCLSLASQLGDIGVTISGIGIGKDWNEDFLENLVNKTGGESVYATDPQSIENFLKSKFRQFSKIYATNVNLSYTLPENVTLNYVFRISPNTHSISKNPLKLGDIPHGRSLTILLEFLIDKVPEDATEFSLIDGDLLMVIPGKNIPKVVQKFSLSRPTSKKPKTEPPPPMLVRALSKLSLYRLQEEAYRHLANNDINKATRKLNNLATRLLSSGEAVLAHTVLLEVDRLEGVTTNKSDNEKKQIKYGTRALLLPAGEEFP